MTYLNKIKNILSNKLLKNILILINGTIIAQIVNFSLTPILSRVYTPNDFGQYAVINSIVIILAAVANGKYDYALMEVKDNKKSKTLFILCIFLAFLTSLLFLVLGLLGLQLNAQWINLEPLDLFFTAWLIFSFSNNNVISVCLNKFNLYKEISIMRVLFSLIYAGVSIILGLFKLGYEGLVYGTVIACLSQNIYGFIKIYLKTEFRNEQFDSRLVKKLINEYKNYPKYTMPSILLNGASVQAPIILLGNLYSDKIAGWYSMTVRIINVPMMIIGNSIGNVFFKEATEINREKDKEKLTSFTNSIFRKLVMFGALPMSIFMVFGESIFKLFLGEDWATAGIYAVYLAPWYFMVFVTSPLSHLFNVLNKQKMNLYLNIFMFISRVLAIALGSVLFINGNKTVLLFAIVGFAIWLVVNSYTLRLVDIKIKNTLFFTLYIFIAFIIFMLIVKIVFNSLMEAL